MNLPHSTPLRVFLAEDSALMRESICGLLAGPGFVVVGSGATPQDCIDGIRRAQPDVVVLDGQLEGGKGLSVLRAFRPLTGLAVVVFTNHASAAHRRRYLDEGVQAVLEKNTEFGQLAQAVRAAWSAVNGQL